MTVITKYHNGERSSPLSGYIHNLFNRIRKCIHLDENYPQYNKFYYQTLDNDNKQNFHTCSEANKL